MPGVTLRVMFRFALIAVLAMAVLSGCGNAHPRAVPNVTGERLDAAEDRLDAAGLHYTASGGGTFGIVIRSNWTVCSQRPAPRRVASFVVLSVARSCSIPDVRGETLGDAEDALREAGIRYSEYSLDGDPIVAESFWRVCRQSPLGGPPGPPVQLFVSHDCYGYDEGDDG